MLPWPYALQREAPPRREGEGTGDSGGSARQARGAEGEVQEVRPGVSASVRGGQGHGEEGQEDGLR